MKFQTHITILSFIFSQICWASLPDNLEITESVSTESVQVAAGCREDVSVDAYMRCLEREYNAGRLRLSQFRMILKNNPRLSSVEDCWRLIEEADFMSCWQNGGHEKLASEEVAPLNQESNLRTSF